MSKGGWQYLGLLGLQKEGTTLGILVFQYWEPVEDEGRTPGGFLSPLITLRSGETLSPDT